VAVANGASTVMAVLALLCLVLGLIVGSFLNVCIYRLPRHESINWPASHCTACNRALAWYENVPLVSWLMLRGRCRTCGERISAMYPIVEAITGTVFVTAYILYGVSALGAIRLLFACAMIVLFAIDLRHHILPNVITVPGIVAGFVASVWLPPGWQSSLLGLVVGGGSLFVIGEVYYRTRGVEGMGMGDVKMLAMIGAFLGWPLMLLTLILASFSGGIFGGLMLVSGRGGMKAALPFGTFLAVGALVAAVAGDPIINWYLGFYR
jgi:leader peptidase (prepilin peptidase)/N-methyltransferase